MINLLLKEEGANGVYKYAIGSYAIVALAPEKLIRLQKELSFSANPMSFQILSEALNKPEYFSFNIGDMFYINNVMLTHFFNKYRERSALNYINLTDDCIIRRFDRGFSDEKEFYALTNDVSDFITFSELILPYISFQQRSTSKWLSGDLIDKIGVSYQNAKSNTDLLELAQKIMQRKKLIDSNNPTR